VAAPPAICPLNECLKLLSGAWTGHVIWYLREGPRCYTELKHDLAGVSAKVLSHRLRCMEKDGIVSRSKRLTSPPTVWYELTEPGRELLEAVERVVSVGQRMKPARQDRQASR
jgi:DNA-binding HxlR family transcriptional regulator